MHPGLQPGAAPSLVISVATCRWTVRWLRFSWRATSRSVSPTASSFRISRCRSSPSPAVLGGPVSAPENRNATARSHSAELVLNAQGQVLRRIERFQFFNVTTPIAGATTQLNQASHDGYALGHDGQQLEPFSY